MNPLSLIVIWTGLLGPVALASDFACLKALIPATETLFVEPKQPRFSRPIFNDSKTAVSIADWNGNRLRALYVYSEGESLELTRVELEDRTESLLNLPTEWFKGKSLGVKIASGEIVRIHPLRPHERPNRPRTPYILSGWLVKGPTGGKVEVPVQREIRLRKAFVQTHSLNKTRFLAWSEATGACD